MARRKWYKQPMSKWLPFTNRSRVRGRTFKLELQIHRWGLLPPRLNCPWRATAAAALVRSTMSIPSATIGAVRLVALSRASSTATASIPTWATTPERAETLCVASRINPKRSVSGVDGLTL